MSVIVGSHSQFSREHSLQTSAADSLRTFSSTSSTSTVILQNLENAGLDNYSDTASDSASDFRPSDASGKSSLDSVSTRSDRSEDKSGSSRRDENHIEAVDGNQPRLSRSQSAQVHGSARSSVHSTLSEPQSKFREFSVNRYS